MPHRPGHILGFDPEEEAAATPTARSGITALENRLTFDPAQKSRELTAQTTRNRQNAIASSGGVDPELEAERMGALPGQGPLFRDPGSIGMGHQTGSLNLTSLVAKSGRGELTPADIAGILQQLEVLSSKAVGVDAKGLPILDLATKTAMDNLNRILDFNREQALIIGRGPEGGMSGRLRTGLEQLMGVNNQITGQGQGGGNRVLGQSSAEAGFLASQQASQKSQNPLAPLLSKLLPGLDPSVWQGLDSEMVMQLLPILLKFFGQQQGTQLQNFGGGLNFASLGR